MNLEDKKAIVAEVTDVAKKSVSAVAADYRGLTVEKLTQLRIKADGAKPDESTPTQCWAGATLHGIGAGTLFPFVA